jgi:ribosomal-protein-alanine N-acetyltransferase
MLSLSFSPFPNLKSRRLFLRQLRDEDENEIFFLRSNEHVNRYVDRPKPNSLQDARDHINKLNNGIANNELIFWGITLLDTAPIIGTICLWNISKETYTAEVGFDLKPAYEGKGIMSEAFSEICAYAFETLKIKKLVGWAHYNNSRSISLLNKFGFRRNMAEEESVSKMELGDMVIYSLDAPAYTLNSASGKK